MMPSDFSGFIAVVKRDCETCRLIEPVLRRLAERREIRVYSQDDPTFPESVSDVIDERALELSYRLDIEIVPTLIQCRDGEETARLAGWKREDWRELTQLPDLGEGLPAFSPGLWLQIGRAGHAGQAGFQVWRYAIASAAGRCGAAARRT